MPGIVHFDIPVDQVERARTFYTKLFDWKIEKVPGDMDYYMVQTSQLDGTPGLGGGMGFRNQPGQQITQFIGVDSIDDTLARIEELGGKVVSGKTPIEGYGYLALCEDTENNSFGLWQDDAEAKM